MKLHLFVLLVLVANVLGTFLSKICFGNVLVPRRIGRNPVISRVPNNTEMQFMKYGTDTHAHGIDIDSPCECSTVKHNSGNKGRSKKRVRFNV